MKNVRSDKRQLVELLGILGVIASLIFVGMQLMLDRRVAQAEQYFNRAESRKADFRARLESDEYLSRESKLWEFGQRPEWWDGEFERWANERVLSGSEIQAGLFDSQILLITFDNLYYQYEQGLLEESFWIEAREALKRTLREPIVRKLYTNGLLKFPIDPVVRGLVVEIESE